MQAVYEIRNMVTGMCYVGGTSNVQARWKNHRCMLRHSRHTNPPLQAAWDANGEDAFEFNILEEVKGSKEHLLAREQSYLDRALRLGLAYNVWANAAGPQGMRLSDEIRRKISAAKRGVRCQPPSAETRHKISKALSRPYPAFVHKVTGKVIPAGINLKQMCHERKLHGGAMCNVKNGKRNHHNGWKLKFDKEA